MSQQVQTETETIRVWPGQVPDADVWRDIGPELERPSFENSRLVRNVSQPTLTVFDPIQARPSAPASSSARVGPSTS